MMCVFPLFTRRRVFKISSLPSSSRFPALYRRLRHPSCRLSDHVRRMPIFIISIGHHHTHSHTQAAAARKRADAEAQQREALAAFLRDQGLDPSAADDDEPEIAGPPDVDAVGSGMGGGEAATATTSSHKQQQTRAALHALQSKLDSHTVGAATTTASAAAAASAVAAAYARVSTAPAKSHTLVFELPPAMRTGASARFSIRRWHEKNAFFPDFFV